MILPGSGTSGANASDASGSRGAPDASALPGLFVSTGMGARGMTLAVLCGELLAAQLEGEPLPVPLRQARALAPQRLLRPS